MLVCNSLTSAILIIVGGVGQIWLVGGAPVGVVVGSRMETKVRAGLYESNLAVEFARKTVEARNPINNR